MTDLFANLALGFATAVSFENLLYAFLGCLLGTLIGVLPGLGPIPTIAMLLPVTYALEPTPALIMLAGIYYGAQYGGSTTAILVRLPGESSSAITLIDGHAMARKGKAGAALAAAAIGSFFAGTVGVVLLAAFAAPLSALALDFGPADYFSLMLLGLVGSVALSSGRLDISLGMIVIGILLGLVGTDVNSGTDRFTFGVLRLSDGIEFTCLAMGLFGLCEIISNLERGKSEGRTTIAPIHSLWPGREDLRRMCAPILRGTAIGSLLGILPGAGATLASFTAWTVEKKVSKHRDEIGEGAIEGVAAPEAANNAAAQGSFIPMLTLGIPGSATMALLIGAMMIHDIQPGPQVMNSHPALFWGLIASMFIGNAMLVLLNLPLIGIWVSLLRIPYHILYPAILVFCCIGVYSVQNSVFDIWLIALIGFAGYLLMKLEISPVPLLLGFVLGPMMEVMLRRAMMISRGDPTVFVRKPISAVLLGLVVLMLVMALLPAFRRRKSALAED